MYLFSINFTNSDVLKNNFSNKITSSFKNISPFFNYMSYVLTTDLNGESIIENIRLSIFTKSNSNR